MVVELWLANLSPGQPQALEEPIKMASVVVCPELTRYQQLASGKLAEAEEEALLAHLERCGACAEKARTLGEPDMLVNLLRQARAGRDEVAAEPVAALIARLSQLRPGETSAVQREDTPMSGAPAQAPAGITAAYQPAPAPSYDFLAPAQAPDEIGWLGPYRILQVLGNGGMGVVFRAEDPQLVRLIALKVMLPALAANASARQRFLREARAAAALKHPHIVTIYQVGQDRDVPFLAMELLEGEPLDIRLEREGQLPVVEVLRIGREMALGLAAAHARQVIHRDIKPGNVWLEMPGEQQDGAAAGGHVKILDFGLARARGEDDQLTQAGAIIGTPAYMAPEQAQGKPLDGRCDLFSLGCVLYRMATGQPAFRGADLVSTLMAVATEEPPAPRRLDTTLPAALSDLIMALLAKDPAERPASATVVVDALQQIERDYSPSPALELPAARQPAPKKKRLLLVGMVALLLGMVLAGLWATGVLRVRTSAGTIVLENVPADAEVLVDGSKVSLKLAGDGRSIEIQASPGQRRLEIQVAGFKIHTREVTVSSGERTPPLHIRLEPLASAPIRPASPPQPKAASASTWLDAFRRDQLAPEVLQWAGNGDANQAPASLVGIVGRFEPIHTMIVRSLVFSPDGHWLASGSGDRTILLRAVATGRVQRVLRGHTGWIMSVAFTPDSRTLVSASFDGTLKFWSVERGEELQTLRPELEQIWGMAISADGRFLAAGGTSGETRLWKWGQWDAPIRIAGQRGQGSGLTESGGRTAALALSPDGNWLAIATRDGTTPRPLQIHRTTDGKLHKTIVTEGPVGDLAFSPDGKFISAYDVTRGVLIFDRESGQSVGKAPANTWGAVTFSPDGKTLAVGSYRHMYTHDIVAQQRVHLFEALNDFHAVAYSPDGTLVAGAESRGTVHVWDTRSGKEQYLELGDRHYVWALALSPDGKTLVSLGDDETLRRWDLAKPGQCAVLSRAAADYTRPPVVAYSPDGRSFLHTETRPWRMQVWDAASSKVRWSLRLSPTAVAFRPDGKALFGARSGPVVSLWDSERGTEEQQFRNPPQAPSWGLALDRAGTLLAVVGSGKEGEIKIWNVVSGAVLHSWRDTSMSAVAFRPDGGLLAVGHEDGTISLWDVPTGKKIRTLAGHSAQVQTLKFTPDGQTLISSGHDGTIRLWHPDGARARQVISLGPPNQRLVFDLDSTGQYVLAGGHSPAIYVLRLPGNDGSPLPKNRPQ